MVALYRDTIRLCLHRIPLYPHCYTLRETPTSLHNEFFCFQIFSSFSYQTFLVNYFYSLVNSFELHFINSEFWIFGFTNTSCKRYIHIRKTYFRHYFYKSNFTLKLKENFADIFLTVWFSSAKRYIFNSLLLLLLYPPNRFLHGLINYKDTKPKCCLYWCIIEFIDWRYSQSCWHFRPSFVNYCTSNFLSGYLSPPPSFPVWISKLTYTRIIEEGRAARKSPNEKFGYFLSMSQQSVSVDIIPNSAVGIFSPKTEGTKTESEIAEMSSWDQAKRGERQEN